MVTEGQNAMLERLCRKHHLLSAASGLPLKSAMSFGRELLQAVQERDRSAMCEWCREGKPIAEPLYGRVNEVWHIPFPETPTDTQRVRCQAEKIVRETYADLFMEEKSNDKTR